MGDVGWGGSVKGREESDCVANESQERKGNGKCEVRRGEKGWEDEHVRNM